jgi:hypothetical protein
MLRTVGLVIGCLVLGLALAGAPAARADTDNPFEGSWVGTFEGSFGQTGTAEWTISDAGRLTGIGVNTDEGVYIEFVGHVNQNGTHHIEANDEGGGGSSGSPFSGIQYFNEDGQLVFESTAVWDDEFTVVAVFDPAP